MNFASLKQKYSEYNENWDLFERWFALNNDKHYVGLIDLLYSDVFKGHKISPLEIVIVLSYMVDEGMIKHAYRVQKEDGTLIGPIYDEPTDIPKEVEGIKIADCYLVSGYVWE